MRIFFLRMKVFQTIFTFNKFRAFTTKNNGEKLSQRKTLFIPDKFLLSLKHNSCMHLRNATHWKITIGEDRIRTQFHLCEKKKEIILHFGSNEGQKYRKGFHCWSFIECRCSSTET